MGDTADTSNSAWYIGNTDNTVHQIGSCSFNGATVVGTVVVDIVSAGYGPTTIDITAQLSTDSTPSVTLGNFDLYEVCPLSGGD
ncbi:hypothetical protein Sste5346_008540 [Sporothrix stenoceras]|uniref:Uncharacterized protein n=1 Tax=Sporothrix stenoceras TaxID=5173 RepID=A0ABR3YPU0_9PEZI